MTINHVAMPNWLPSERVEGGTLRPISWLAESAIGCSAILSRSSGQMKPESFNWPMRRLGPLCWPERESVCYVLRRALVQLQALERGHRLKRR